MTSKIIAQSDRQQKSEKPQGSGILQRAAVRSVENAGVHSTDENEVLGLSNWAFSKDFSQVPVSTTQPQQFHARNLRSHPMPPIQAKLSIGKPGDRVIQRKGEMTGNSQVSSEVPRPNQTGLPDRLKTGIENLSGYSMDGVRVHYNSDLPAQLQALAYAQGTEIHVAPGEEEHLRHEAWHVVQQKQGRVKPTMQMKGVGINDDEGLEQEADVMGGKALGVGAALDKGKGGESSKMRLNFLTSSISPVFQLQKSHAEKVIKERNLKIDSTKEEVKKYVNNLDNPKNNRQALLSAWNRKSNNNHAIQIPKDLVPQKVDMAQMDNFSNWDSDNEDEVDIPKVVGKKRIRSLTLQRGDGKLIKNVPLLENSDAIRLGRQVVKRNEYQHLPFITKIGPRFIEYKHPGTNDIYGTPLIKVDDNTFKRAGTSSDFNWANLSLKLQNEDEEPEKKRAKLDKIFSIFSGENPSTISEGQSEAIAAISCDFMKGSGAMKFILEAQIQTQMGSKEVDNIGSFFTGQVPIYLPSKGGGRAEVTKATPLYKAERETAFLLMVNNCLINAIAQVALGRNATIGELVEIRTQIGNLGEMLYASQRVLRIISVALDLTRGIIVREPNGEIDTFGNTDDNPIMVRHTGSEHFVPDNGNQPGNT